MTTAGPGSGPALREAVRSVADGLRGLAAALRQARETVAVAHRVVTRADRVTAELEEPLRALVPGLRRLADVLDDPVVDDLPDTVRKVREDLLPLLRTVAETHDRVTSVAGLVDEAMRPLGTLGGIDVGGLLGRRRPSPRVIPPEE